MGARLLVLALGERVDRAELLAAAAQPLELAPRSRRAPRRSSGASAAARARARAARRSAPAPRRPRRGGRRGGRPRPRPRSPPRRRRAAAPAARPPRASRRAARRRPSSLAAARRASAPRAPRRARRPRRGPRRAASQSSPSAREQLGLALEPLPRASPGARLPSMSSTRRAIRAARSAPPRTAPSAGARRLAVVAGAARRRRAPRSAAPSASPLRSSPARDRIVAGARAGRRGELVGERAERRAAALERAPRARRSRAASASARTLIRSWAARSAVSRPQASVRSRSRSASAPRSPCGARLTSASFASTLRARASRGLVAARSAPASSPSWPSQLVGEQPRAQLAAPRARAGRGCSAACAWRFSGRSRRARLALDVERAVEVVLGALELQLGAAAALAVLAEPGRLLDQQAPLARLRVDDRLDPALADHRVHLAAEVGVGERPRSRRRAGSGRR